MYYILPDLNDSNKTKVEWHSHEPANMLYVMPDELYGKAYKIVDGAPVLDALAEAQRLSDKAAKAVSDIAARSERLARMARMNEDKVKNLTLPQLRSLVKDLLDHMGL